MNGYTIALTELAHLNRINHIAIKTPEVRSRMRMNLLEELDKVQPTGMLVHHCNVCGAVIVDAAPCKWCVYQD